jgi:GNAT superfamily N-acetyltransferase
VKYRIRQTDDLDLIIDLDRQIFPADAKLQGPQFLDSEWWVVRDSFGEPVAFAGAHKDTGPGDFQAPDGRPPGCWINTEVALVRSGVLKGHRGRGLQARLVRARLAWAAKVEATMVSTYTSTQNIASMRALISCGFRPYKYEFIAEQNAFLHFRKRLTRA